MQKYSHADGKEEENRERCHKTMSYVETVISPLVSIVNIKSLLMIHVRSGLYFWGCKLGQFEEQMLQRYDVFSVLCSFALFGNIVDVNSSRTILCSTYCCQGYCFHYFYCWHFVISVVHLLFQNMNIVQLVLPSAVEMTMRNLIPYTRV